MQNDTRSPESEPKNSALQGSIEGVLQMIVRAHEDALALLQQTELAYGRLLPRQLLTLLERESIVDVKLGDQVERKLTIMFSDIRNFTQLSESMSPGENFEFINSYLSQMEPVISAHHGIIDKYMGDAIMALFIHGADDALTGSIAMLEKLTSYNVGRARAGYVPTQIGIGLNTGIVIIGTVGGANRMDSTVIGDAVNLTSRIEEATKTYQVPLLISQNTLYELKDPSRFDIRFLDRIRVKGKMQPLSLYEIFDNDPETLRHSKRAFRARFEEAIAHYHMKHIPHALELLTQCVEDAPDDIPARIYVARCHEFLATGQHQSTGELDTFLEWRQEFNTGEAALDKAHLRLFDETNTFIQNAQQDARQAVLGISSVLASHAQSNFKVEEELMRSHAYPFLESHLQEHQRFIENFMALSAEADVGECNPRLLSFRFQLLLFDWFNGHIAKSDRHMARHLSSTTGVAAK